MAEETYTYKTVTPYLVVADGDAEIGFLQAAFGAREMVCHRNEQNAVMHAELLIGDSLVMLGQAGETVKARDAAFYLWVEDVDALYGKALASGARSEFAPEDKPYGHRMAGVVDEAGLTWWIGSPVKPH